MKERFYSLDVFRGATVAFMILVNNQMGKSYAPLDHAEWHGLTPTDLVFPFFLFAVGNALSFVMPGLEKGGTSLFLRKVSRRTLSIFLIGFLLNWFPFFRWDHDHIVLKGWTWINQDGVLAGVRVMGVLSRIALCYFFASVIIYFYKVKGAAVISLLLLVGYWLLCYTLGTGADPYSISGYFGTALDKAAFGEAHMYHGEGVAFDPEGLASTLPAITQVIFGYFAGRYIREKGKTYEMLCKLFIASLALLFVGYCWDSLFPVNKKIWTSSYVLVSTGLAMASLAVLIYVIEFGKCSGRWSRFFDVFGKNPLFIFVLSGLVPRALGLIRIENTRSAEGQVAYLTPLGWFFEHVCKPVAGEFPKNASLLYAFCLVGLYWLVAFVLDKRKIYIKV